MNVLSKLFKKGELKSQKNYKAPIGFYIDLKTDIMSVKSECETLFDNANFNNDSLLSDYVAFLHDETHFFNQEQDKNAKSRLLQVEGINAYEYVGNEKVEAKVKEYRSQYVAVNRSRFIIATIDKLVEQLAKQSKSIVEDTNFQSIVATLAADKATAERKLIATGEDNDSFARKLNALANYVNEDNRSGSKYRNLAELENIDIEGSNLLHPDYKTVDDKKLRPYLQLAPIAFIAELKNLVQKEQDSYRKLNIFVERLEFESKKDYQARLKGTLYGKLADYNVIIDDINELITTRDSIKAEINDRKETLEIIQTACDALSELRLTSQREITDLAALNWNLAIVNAKKDYSKELAYSKKRYGKKIIDTLMLSEEEIKTCIKDAAETGKGYQISHTNKLENFEQLAEKLVKTKKFAKLNGVLMTDRQFEIVKNLINSKAIKIEGLDKAFDDMTDDEKVSAFEYIKAFALNDGTDANSQIKEHKFFAQFIADSQVISFVQNNFDHFKNVKLNLNLVQIYNYMDDIVENHDTFIKINQTQLYANQASLNINLQLLEMQIENIMKGKINLNDIQVQNRDNIQAVIAKALNPVLEASELSKDKDTDSIKILENVNVPEESLTALQDCAKKPVRGLQTAIDEFEKGNQDKILQLISTFSMQNENDDNKIWSVKLAENLKETAKVFNNEFNKKTEQIEITIDQEN